MVAFINLNKSKGNYVVDSDGNTLLDMAGTEFNPLGYNHQAMIKVSISYNKCIYRQPGAKNSMLLLLTQT